MDSKNAHLYLPFVQALAEGKVVEYYNGSKWINQEEYIFSSAPEDYRIAKPKTIVKSRRYIWKDNDLNDEYSIFTVQTEEEINYVTNASNLVKWIDEDWVYTEI